VSDGTISIGLSFVRRRNFRRSCSYAER